MKYSVLGIALGILAVSILVMGSFFVGFAPSVAAVNVTDTAKIDILVGTLTLIDMNPAEFSWSGVDPGTDTARKQVQIENIGSTNFTWIWFNVTQPTDRPFATGLNASYVASNMLWISKEDADTYYAVDRLEFNETRSLIYLTDPDGTIPPNSSKFAYGRFRNTSMEYFWFYDYSAGTCGALSVGDVAHSQGETGSIDFSACDSGLTGTPGTNCRDGPTTESSIAGWCYADVNIGGENYTVAVQNSTDGYRVRWFHWNVEAPGGLDYGEGSSFHNDYFSSSLIIYPGNSTVADLVIYMPYGVADGKLAQGLLTVTARNLEAS